MKIGLIIYGSLDTKTGGYFYDRMLTNYMERQGDHVEVISIDFKNYLRNIGDNFSSPLYYRLLKAEVDVLLQDELNHTSLFWINSRLRSRVSYPIITIVHHLSYLATSSPHTKLLYYFLEKRYLSTLDGFIFNSHTTQRSVEYLVGGKLNGVVAYPGRDHIQPSITPREVVLRIYQTDPFRILYIGNLVPHKGLHTLIKALSKIDYRNWMLTVIGNPSISTAYVKSLHDLVYSKNLGSQVSFLGFVTDSELKTHLEKSHVLAVPSIYEGFGIVYLEALGFGLPIIATTGGAAKEIIKHGREGFLVPPENPVLLGKSVSKLMQDLDLLRHMSLNAISRYKDFPTWSESMYKIYDFLKNVI
ncbi:MAG: glycosyltransferase [Nitrososphaeria archaeon]|nr:glycosyltransferase [Nitrososphaeria archaeon]NIQ33412.1 glycosyltransferase [Nitrososphaeria archaeon]